MPTEPYCLCVLSEGGVVEVGQPPPDLGRFAFFQ